MTDGPASHDPAQPDFTSDDSSVGAPTHGHKPRVEFYQDVAGNWRYRVVGGNGEIVAASEGYVSKWNAQRGFRDMQRIVAVVYAEAITDGTLTFEVLLGSDG